MAYALRTASTLIYDQLQFVDLHSPSNSWQQVLTSLYFSTLLLSQFCLPVRLSVCHTGEWWSTPERFNISKYVVYHTVQWHFPVFETKFRSPEFRGSPRTIERVRVKWRHSLSKAIILDHYVAKTRKRCEIGYKLILLITRNSHTGFRSVPKSVTLSDLELPMTVIMRYFSQKKQPSEPTASNSWS